MPPLQAIADAGGWAVAVFVIGTVAIALARAFFRGDLVIGSVHRAEIAARVALEVEGIRLARRHHRLERERDRFREQLRAAKAARRVAR